MIKSMMLPKVVFFVRFLGSFQKKTRNHDAPTRSVGTWSELNSRHMSGSNYRFFSYIVREREFLIKHKEHSDPVFLVQICIRLYMDPTTDIIKCILGKYFWFLKHISVKTIAEFTTKLKLILSIVEFNAFNTYRFYLT